MKKYRVTFIQEIEGYVDVEADSEHEAENIAYEKMGEIIETHESIECVDLEEIK